MSEYDLLKTELNGMKAQIDSLNANRITMAKRIRDLEEYVDTVSSPMWKRIWFVIQGWRFRQLGRWYKASWNDDGKQWD